MPNILVVCTANICRSPVAKALLEKGLQERGCSEGWTVSSAGTWAQVRRGASHHSVVVAAKRGLDITGHVAEMLGRQYMRDADLVLCMESGHAEALRFEFPEDAYKVHLFSEMVGQNFSISDPYGGPYSTYEQMATELTEVIDQGLDRIIELAEANAAKR